MPAHERSSRGIARDDDKLGDGRRARVLSFAWESIYRRRLRRIPASVWALLAIAMVLRLGVVVATIDTPTTLDPADFSRNAISLVRGDGFPQSNRAPGGGASAFRPPVYPLFLAGIYYVAGQEAPGAARVVEAILLGPLTVALVGFIALRIWGRRVGVMALGIAAVAPPMVVLSTALISEALFVPLVLGAVAAALEARRSRRPLLWAIVAGVLLGLAELTRTNAIILLPPLAFAVWQAGRRLSRGGLVRPLALTLAAVATIAPWTVRNWLVLHTFVPVSTEIGYTLAGTYNQVARANTQYPAVWNEAEHGASPEYGAILFNAEIHRWDEVQYGNALTRQALREIRQHPAYLLKVAAWNTIRIFHLGELGLAVQNLGNTDIPAVPAWFEILGFYLLGLLALAGIATRRARQAPWWLWSVPLLLLTTVFITGFIRFRSGIDPFLAMLAALAVVSMIDRRRARRPPVPPAEPAPAADQWARATTINTMMITPTMPAPSMTGR